MKEPVPTKERTFHGNSLLKRRNCHNCLPTIASQSMEHRQIGKVRV